MSSTLPLLTALLLGSVHAIEADHMAAVSAFAVRRPRPGAAVLFGLRWALGHGGVVILFGMALVLLGLELPAAASHWLERLVGVGLIVLGAWTVAGARAMHAHVHTHGDGTTHLHLHSHLTGSDHDHRHGHGHAATAVGALHGLAGTAPVVALIPLAGLDSATFAAGYLLLFAIGTAGGMALFAMLAGWIAGRAAERSAGLARGVAAATGVITIGLGLVWLVR